MNAVPQSRSQGRMPPGIVASRLLRALIVEGSDDDTTLLVHQLKRGGYDISFRQVDTAAAMEAALNEEVWDVIFCDYTMPHFSGPEALALSKERHLDIPFIYVSGNIGEDVAVDAMKAGAHDCVMKNNLARLLPVVAHALREAEARSERRRAEEELRKLSRAVEHSPASITITNTDGNIEYVNPKFVEITGYSMEEVIGQSPRILRSGETQPSAYNELWATITAGREWHGELRNRRKNGELFWELACISPIRDPSGAITHFVAVEEDMTERKQIEAQLLRAQRMEAIGMLASGVAHDLNNILAPILMSVPILRDALAGTRIQPIVSTIEACAERGAGIVKQVLTFARGLEGARVLVQARHLLRDMEKIARETFPRSITIRNMAPTDLWTVMGDATQLHQVLLNLCINARDAMPNGGTLTLDADNLQIDENYAAMTLEATPGPYLMLEVSDTGLGIAAEILPKIFELFFTTKEVGIGTGLGLSTVHGIAKSHRGFVTVESEIGKGSTFRVFLPAKPEAAVSVSIPATETFSGNGELILLVDDEASIRTIAQVVLQANDYRVLLAADGTEALAAFAQHSGEIAAVVTDIVMPFMDGAALIRALRRMQPDLCIIVSTGHGEKAQVSDLRVDGLLNKPYDANTLLRSIHAGITGRAEPILAPQLQPSTFLSTSSKPPPTRRQRPVMQT